MNWDKDSNLPNDDRAEPEALGFADVAAEGSGTGNADDSKGNEDAALTKEANSPDDLETYHQQIRGRLKAVIRQAKGAREMTGRLSATAESFGSVKDALQRIGTDEHEQVAELKDRYETLIGQRVARIKAVADQLRRAKQLRRLAVEMREEEWGVREATVLALAERWRGSTAEFRRDFLQKLADVERWIATAEERWGTDKERATSESATEAEDEASGSE